MKISQWIVVAAMAVSGPVWAGTAVDLLDLGLGARPAGMGGAYTAVANDSMAMFWNPAGLATLGSAQSVGLMRTTAFETNYLLAYWTGQYGDMNVGVGYVSAGVDDILHVGQSQYLTDLHRYSGPDGTFSYSNSNWIFSGAKRLSDSLAVGGNLRMVSQTLYGASATGFGVDMGGLYTISDQTTVGLVINNLISPTYKWGTGTDHGPTTIKLGVSQLLLENKLRVGLDLGFAEYSSTGFGMEYSVLPNAAIRTGISNGRLTAGLGVSFENILIDYSWSASDMSEIDSVSQFQIAYRFEPAQPNQPESRPQPIAIEPVVEPVKAVEVPTPSVPVPPVVEPVPAAVTPSESTSATDDQVIPTPLLPVVSVIIPPTFENFAVIQYSVLGAQTGEYAVDLTINDSRGAVVKSIISHQTVRSGSHTVTWDGTDGDGRPVMPGAYSVRISASVGGIMSVGASTTEKVPAITNN